MDNPEVLSTLSTQDTGQINVRENEGLSRAENPEKLSTLSTQDRGQINVRENRGDNQEWTIHRHCQH
jgi:hypothetical protein